MTDWGYWSKEGLFTLVMGSDGGLAAAEINAKDAAIVRAAGGFLYDREGFARDAAKAWSDKMARGSFTPIGKKRVFLLTKGG